MLHTVDYIDKSRRSCHLKFPPAGGFRLPRILVSTMDVLKATEQASGEVNATRFLGNVVFPPVRDKRLNFEVEILDNGNGKS